MDANWWNNALQSYDVGREHRADRENAQAFQEGGYDAVEQAAGNRGDLRTAMTTRRFQDDRMQQAYQRMEQIRPLALGALDRVGQLPVEQRTQFLNQPHIRQRFIDWGITPEQYDAAAQQIANPETGEQALASYRAAFTQHQDPNWQLATVPTEDGQGVEQRMIAPDPTTGAIQRGEGSIPVPRGEIQSFGSGGLYRENPNAPNGIEIIREPRSVQGGGTTGAPSGYRWSADGGALEPIPGGPRDPAVQGAPRFPADQRARVAISFEPALEAAQQMEQAEANAIRRQGTHGSNTPLGQDWGARMAEAIPFDGGSVARMIGGADYQAYTRASNAFEAAILPILSGAAVTESEAQRVVRAALPRQGDDQATLQAKARQRRQMLNGAATIAGRPLPFPQDAVSDWALRAQNAVRQTQGAGGIGLESLSDEQLDQLEQELMNAQP